VKTADIWSATESTCVETVRSDIFCLPTARDEFNHPYHYTRGEIEVIDVIDDWRLDFTEGCILKYLARWKYKGGVDDLRKLKWYAERLLDKNTGA
jgi:hypothetical protein